MSGEHHTRRICWCVEVKRASPLGCIASERFANSVGARFISWDEYEPALAMGDEILDWRPVRRKDQYVVAGIDDRLKSAKQPLHAAVYYDDIVFTGRNAIAILQLVGNRATQFCNS